MPVIPLTEALAALRAGDITIDQYRLMRGLAVVDEQDVIRACASGAPAEVPEPEPVVNHVEPPVDASPAPVGWWQRLRGLLAPPINDNGTNERTPS